MNFGDLFYRLPRLTFLAIGFILLTGISSLLNLPRQEDPTMTERYATVETHMAGATAMRMESLITEKVENALREVPEVKKLESTTRAGYSIVQVELYDHVGKNSVDLVWSEVRDKLAQIRGELPAAANDPLLTPRGPVAVTLAIAIDAKDTPVSVQERIAIELKSRLSALPGTKETEVFGEPEQEVLVEIDPFALARVGLSIEHLTSVIGGSDTKFSTGRLNTRASSLVVEVKGELSSVERISRIPLTVADNGNFVRVSDVATITKSIVDPPRTLALIDGQRSIVVTTTMETGRRVDDWVAIAADVVENYQSELPDRINLRTIIDQNKYTTQRLASLASNLLLAITLVLIALLFLMGVRAALIIGFALPLTMGIVLSGLLLMDIPLHQMSVTGLIIALGLLIDNAIVVVEEYKLNRRRGVEIQKAIANAVHHLFIPLLASTATTVFAFMPIANTPGGVGDFTGAMAISVVLSVSASFLLAMTIIPTLAGYIEQRFPPKSQTGWWVNGYSPERLSAVYRKSVQWVIEKPIRGITVSFILPVAGLLMATGMTTSFFPPVDRNQFQVQLSIPANSSIHETRRQVEEVRKHLAGIEEIESNQWFIGEGAPEVYYNMMQNSDGVPSFANGFVTTRDVDDPRKILPQLQQELLQKFPEARIMTMPFEQGPPFSAPLELRIVGPELQTLREIGKKLRLVLSETSAVTYTTATLSGSIPQVSVYPKENMTSMLGLQNQDLPQQLNGKLIGLRAGSVMEGTTEVPITVRYNDRIRQGLDGLTSSPLVGERSAPYSGIPLEQVADVVLEPAPSRIDRHQGERTNTISGFLLPYAYPSVALKDFRDRLASQNIQLPKGYRIEFGGEEEQRGEAIGNMVGTFAMYIWLIVAVVVLSLNSFRFAFIIGLVGSLSVGLALLSVSIAGYPLGYMTLIGTLGLIGLAINGAIIILSALKSSELARAADVAESTQIVVDATRHIVSTTVTTIGGFMPLILFGGHFWPPLAMAIAGGVIGSAILALYLVPAMFSLFAQRDVTRHAMSDQFVGPAPA